MNKKIFLIIVLIAVILIGFGVIAFINSNRSKEIKNSYAQDNGEEASEEETKTASEAPKFGFIYNINELTDEWWNSTNEEWKSFNYTNKYLFDLRWKSVLGNSEGKIKIRPVDFTENIKVGYKSSSSNSEYYTLSIQNNKFLIPRQIKVINDKINNDSARLQFYVVGNDLWFYYVALQIDEKPENIELIDGIWKTELEENTKGYIEANSYLPINTDYCLHISYPVAQNGERVKIEKDVLKELANNITALIHLEKINETSNIDNLSFKVELDDIYLDTNTIIHTNSMQMKSWHSGLKEIAGALHNGDNIITAYNKNNDYTYIVEFNKDKKDLEQYLTESNLALKQYNMNGRDIYITYYTDDATESFKGKYQGIIFQIDDTYYEVSGMNLIDASKINIDTWIKNMCDGVITFK